MKGYDTVPVQYLSSARLRLLRLQIEYNLRLCMCLGYRWRAFISTSCCSFGFYASSGPAVSLWVHVFLLLLGCYVHLGRYRALAFSLPGQ